MFIVRRDFDPMTLINDLLWNYGLFYLILLGSLLYWIHEKFQIDSHVQMKIWAPEFGFIVILVLLSVQAVCGIRFVIDREECFSHNVEYEGDTIHASFVVIKVDASWHYSKDGVDLVVSPTFLHMSFRILYISPILIV